MNSAPRFRETSFLDAASPRLGVWRGMKTFRLGAKPTLRSAHMFSKRNSVKELSDSRARQGRLQQQLIEARTAEQNALDARRRALIEGDVDIEARKSIDAKVVE